MAGKKNPRVLVITPEITSLPPGMGKQANSVVAKAGGMADVTAGIVTALFELGADVHVALPNYRRLFRIDINRLVENQLQRYKSKLQTRRIHFAEDRLFYYSTSVYGGGGSEVPRISLRFQREVINNIVPIVRPDLIHCNDWVTGLIPAQARRMGIPCLMTLHNIHTYELPLADVEESGIDAAEFWQYLYYRYMPHCYEETRDSNHVDLLASGVFAAHYVNTVSPTFLNEIIEGAHDFVPGSVREEIRQKNRAGCAAGILNAPPERYQPDVDSRINCTYSPDTHPEGKARNKQASQERLGLRRDARVPLFFWPSRLDPTQKGCELLAHILYDTVSAYWHDGLQLALVADGPYQRVFRDIVEHHNLADRIAVEDFDERLSHLGFAASDFTLMPSRFEPCGLPQMIGSKYGSLPIVHDTGGLHDTVGHVDPGTDRGNGFVFETYDPNGLRWAIDQAMLFHKLPAETKRIQISRIMREARDSFNHAAIARRYFDLYEQMLDRPLINPMGKRSRTA